MFFWREFREWKELRRKSKHFRALAARMIAVKREKPWNPGLTWRKCRLGAETGVKFKDR
jgi:hypothetical protein